MIELSDAHAMAIERSCAVTAVALSGQRREGARLVTGEHRQFGLSSALDFVHVPYPSIGGDWTRRTLTCGVALQCSPSKERLVTFRLNELSARELRALTLVEASVAVGWIASNWPGLLAEARRMLPDLPALPADTDAGEMVNRAVSMSRTGAPLSVHPILGRLPLAYTAPQGLTDRLRRSFGRMPWTTTQKRLPRPYSVPVGGDGGVRNPNLPPPEPAPGQRPRHHTGASAGHPLPRMELLDTEFHARPCCRSRTRPCHPHALAGARLRRAAEMV